MAIHRFKHLKSSFTWIDVCNPTATELQELSAEFDLNQYTLSDCLEPDHLPKAEDLGDVKFLITRKILDQELGHKLHTVQQLSTKVAVFFNEEFIITVHRLPQAFIDDLQAQFEQSNSYKNPAELVAKILLQVLHSYNKPALQLAAELDKFETAVFLRNTQASILSELYYLKRKINILVKLLILTEDITHSLNAYKARNLVLQDAKDLHTKLLTLFNQLHDDVGNLQQIYLSIAAQKTNEVMKVLTIFSVFFLPLTFIVGIYGMNFKFMPELESTWGYPLVLASMVAITAFIYWWFKRKKWF
ncbi:MAG: CorA family divalent cation transporter [Sphingobacteriaceae bacterium]